MTRWDGTQSLQNSWLKAKTIPRNHLLSLAIYRGIPYNRTNDERKEVRTLEDLITKIAVAIVAKLAADAIETAIKKAWESRHK